MRTSVQVSNRARVKSTKELTELMQDVMKRARLFGASDASVAVHHDTGFSIDVRMGEVETVAFSEDFGASVVVYKGCQKGSASSTDISSHSLDDMISKALHIAEASAADPCFGLADKALQRRDHFDLDLIHEWSLTPENAIALAKTCEKEALGFDSRIKNSDGVNVSTYTFSHGYANSHGFLDVVDSSLHSISCSLIAGVNDEMQRDYDYTSSTAPTDLKSVSYLAKSAAERAVSRLGARSLPTAKVPVLFSNRVSAGLMSAFIGAISGMNLYRKNSFLLDSIGQQVFPKNIRIHDEPYLLRGLGSAAFDGEGVMTRPNVWVEEGKIQQYVLNSYSARKMGLKTSGNSGGVFNLTVDPTAGDLQDMLKKMGRGLLITELMGQGVNGLTGDYSRGASGFWVENGEIQHPVIEVTIAGNLKAMFSSIVAIGNDWNPNYSTRCGSIWIEEMMVAGQN